MKTDYTEEIKSKLQEWYAPVTDPKTQTKNTVFKTLEDVHLDIISILPGKWIDETDTYESLIDLNFKSFPVKIDTDKDKISFRFFLEPKKIF